MSILFNVGDVISVRHNFSLGESRAFNVLHFQIAAKTGILPNANTTLAEVAKEAFENWAPGWNPAASVDVSFDGTTAQNISPAPRSRSVTHTPAAPVAGAMVGDALPLQDSITLLKMSDYGERWGLGRVFFVGLAEAAQEDGVVTNVVATAALLALAESLDNQLIVNPAGWTMTLNPVLYHAPTPETDDKPATPERITPITEGMVSDFIIKSMKTRRPGKGI